MVVVIVLSPLMWRMACDDGDYLKAWWMENERSTTKWHDRNIRKEFGTQLSNVWSSLFTINLKQTHLKWAAAACIGVKIKWCSCHPQNGLIFNACPRPHLQAVLKTQNQSVLYHFQNDHNHVDRPMWRENFFQEIIAFTFCGMTKEFLYWLLHVLSLFKIMIEKTCYNCQFSPYFTL